MLDACILIAALVASDDRPTAADRLRLPSEPICRAQLEAASARVAALEFHAGISPSRAHLLAADLADARALRDWWAVARTVAQSPYDPVYDRQRMSCLRGQLGAAEWFCGNWPILCEVQP